MSNPSIDLPIIDTFTPALGQTVFQLSEICNSDNAVVRVNGVTYNQGDSFTIVGSVVTWLDDPFTLDPADEFVVEYYSLWSSDLTSTSINPVPVGLGLVGLVRDRSICILRLDRTKTQKSKGRVA